MKSYNFQTTQPTKAEAAEAVRAEIVRSVPVGTDVTAHPVVVAAAAEVGKLGDDPAKDCRIVVQASIDEATGQLAADSTIVATLEDRQG